MAPGYRIRIYDSRVDSLFNDNGVVGVGTRRLGEEAKAIATDTAPRNSYGVSQGMAYRHRFRTRSNGGGRYFTSTLTNEADYALFVHEGTTGPIRASNPKKKMPIAGSAQNVFVFKKVVRGQKKNPWMAEAGTAAMRRLGYLR